MLVIDDNKLKLLKMLEALLKVSNTNRTENLNNYKKIVVEIDTKAFNDIIEKIKSLNEHNHSLEEELEFLESIKDTYNQLLELESSFKRVCEINGDKNLKLSDLSQLNIEYIENRISAINGYLMNIKNIETNKAQLQELSEQLVVEEKKKTVLENRLQTLEESLKYNFINAEGRNVSDGNRQTSIIAEYKELNFDFEELLNDTVSRDKLLFEVKLTTNEAENTFKATKICFELTPNAENRAILEENQKSLLKVKYKLIMLEILKLLSEHYIDYDSCKIKREQLSNLIENRKKILKSLGVNFSIDPFDRTKIKEQLDTIMSMADSSKIINNIRKRISEITTRTEEMRNQNSNYLILLNDAKNLIESKTSLNDIDITSVELPISETPKQKEITSNQVVKIEPISSKLNMNKISQQTTSVINRVYQMLNRKSEIVVETKKEFIPELIVVPSVSENIEKEPIFDAEMFEESFIVPPKKLDEKAEPNEVVEQEKTEDLETEIPNLVESPQISLDLADLFETVNPFEEPVLFTEKSDDDIPKVSHENESLPVIEPEETEEEEQNDEIKMPSMPAREMNLDAFWPTQGEIEEPVEETVNQELSFDDQIKILMSPKENDSKIRKKVA